MTFDPRKCGARCDRCPLGPGNPFQSGEWAPLPADIEEGALGAVVVAGPSPNDASDGVRYLISGRENRLWREALRAEGRERGDFSVVPLISCLAATGAQDEEGHWKKMDAKLKAVNKKREAAGEEALLHPIEACRPRFQQDIAPYNNIIAFEKEASKAFTGDNSGIRSICGDLIALDSTGRRLADKNFAHRRVVPTVSPGFALKYPKWEQAFRANVSKALRWFESRLRWTEPDITMEPTPEELDAWLSVPARYWCYDIETDGILVQTTRIRCIALATPDTKDRPARAIGLTILGDGDMPVHSGALLRRYLAVMRKHMTEADRPWVGHNAIKFDNAVLEAQWGFSPGDNLRDSMFAARASNPDFPKGLKLWGRILTDVEAWETTEKGDDLATGNVSPESRLRYCCYDTVVNCRIFDPLVKVAHERGMMRPLDERLKPEGWPANLAFNLWNVDQEAQRRAKRMHERGIYIDEPRRKALVEDYTQRVAYHEAIVRDIMQSVGTKYNNPNSYDQIRDILYGRQHWDLPMPAGMKAREYFTDSGLPGTDDNVMRAYMVDASTNEVQRTMLYHLRLFRRYKNKVLGTVLLPLDPRRKPASVMAAMPAGYVDEREMVELLGEGTTLDDVKGTFVWPDGRVRSNWSAHVTSVGRYSSSKPNIQNIGNKKGSGPLKGIFVAGPDCILIGADLAQAHLYIAACDWGITPLLDTLEKGWDLHGAFAANVLGARYTQADGWGPRGYDPKGKPVGGTAKAIRDMCKTFRYAWMYWASPPTIWAVMRGTEGDPADMARLRKALGREPVIKDFLAASMPYVDLELAKIIRMDKDAHRAEPHWARAWERQMNRFKRDGYIEEPVFGRRSGDLEGGKPQAVVNYGVLAAESSIMRIVEHRIEALFPETETETGRVARGLIHQCHDSVAVEVPLPRGYSKQDHAAWVSAVKTARAEKREPPPLHPELEEKRRLLESCMSVKVPGWPVAICGEADVGLTLKDV
jgi:hypothetical protein